MFKCCTILWFSYHECLNISHCNERGGLEQLSKIYLSKNNLLRFHRKIWPNYTPHWCHQAKALGHFARYVIPIVRYGSIYLLFWSIVKPRFSIWSNRPMTMNILIHNIFLASSFLTDTTVRIQRTKGRCI